MPSTVTLYAALILVMACTLVLGSAFRVMDKAAVTYEFSTRKGVR